MNHKITQLIISVLLSVGTAQLVHAQNNSNYQVTGMVTDSEEGGPVEFATVTLLNAQDSSLVTGAVTNPEGVFNIKAPAGDFMVKVSFVSYKSKIINNISLNNETPLVELSQISIAPDAKTMQEVEIVGERSRMTMELDKRVFSVEKDLANIGGSAADVLDNIPSIMVDVEGNVSLRGNSGVRILVNGQQTGMLGIDGVSGLQQLPANLIEQVEVITNPSARYDAEGEAGVINIVLKKNQLKGVNGTFDFTAGYPHQYNAALNVNYRLGKVNFFTNYGIRYNESPGRGYTSRVFTQGGEQNTLNQDSERMRTGLSNTFRGGLDFSPDKYNTFTGSIMYRISDDQNLTEIDYREFNGSNRLISAWNRLADEGESEENLEYALNYRRTFERKGHEWTASLSYNEGPEEEIADIVERFLNTDLSFADEDPLFQYTYNLEDQSNLIFQTDYVHPFSKNAKFEAGLKSSLRDIGNDYSVQNRVEEGIFEEVDSLSNEFVYDENIHAAYGIYSNKYNQFSYQVGLRVEVTDIATNLLDTEEFNSKQYTNFFPSAHVTYEMNPENSMQVSYSRRLERPSFRYLIPFFNFNNPQNIRGGNPDLDPEFTDSYEIGYIKNWEKSTLTSSVYYRNTQGVIQWISRVNDEGIAFRRPENLAVEEAFGFEFILDKEFSDWWKLNGSFNFFRNIIDGGNLEESFQADTYTWMTRVNSRMTLPGNIEFQTMLNYRAPMETAQGTRLSITSVDLALSKDIIKGKGTIALRVSDLFNSRIYRSETFGEDFALFSEYQRRLRQVLMNFSYRLNQKKSRKGGRRGSRGGGDFDGM